MGRPHSNLQIRQEDLPPRRQRHERGRNAAQVGRGGRDLRGVQEQGVVLVGGGVEGGGGREN